MLGQNTARVEKTPVEESKPAADREVVGNWDMNRSLHTEVLPASIVEEGRYLIRSWAPRFPGNTWVRKHLGVPTLFARIDGVIDAAGSLQVFEVEERPCGMGATGRINPDFALRRDALMQKWPKFRWVKSDLRVTDDELWLGEGLTLAEAKAYDGLLLPRNRPDEFDFHCLEGRAVSSVSEEGNKSYGVELGLWRPLVARPDLDEGPGNYLLEPELHDPCFIKPCYGTRAHLVTPFVPNKHRDELRSRVVIPGSDCQGFKQVARMVARSPNRTMYVQPFIESMKLAHQPDRNTILRFYYGYDPTTRDWVPMGGVWMALDRLVVHGTDQTITGPLVIK